MRLLLLLAVCMLLGGCQASPRAQTMSSTAFLATYFLGNGQDGVYLACSDDGLNFTPLLEPNVPILSGEVGADRITRDPCVARGPDGRWHMVWTSGWYDTGIGLAHSDDLVHWSPQQTVPVMGATPGALNAWAPEIAFDDKSGQFLIFWSSTVTGRFPETLSGGDPGPTPGSLLNHRIYRTTTTDFVTFTPTQLMYDPGFNCIDATLLRLDRVGTGWLLLIKNETRTPPQKNIRVVRAVNPLAVEAPASGSISGRYWAEGPTAFEVGNRVRVLFDRYTEARFGGVESDNLIDWFDISEKVNFPPGARHGSVLPVDPALIAQVRAGLAPN